MSAERPVLDPFFYFKFSGEPWRYVLFEHRHPIRGRHFDMMFESSSEEWLLDFEGFPVLGSSGRQVVWRYYGPMRRAYLNIQLRQNAELGVIKRMESGIFSVERISESEIQLRLTLGRKFAAFSLVRKPDGSLNVHSEEGAPRKWPLR